MIPESQHTVELKTAVTIIRDALDRGIEAQNLRQYVRDSGDIEIGGKPISDAMFAGVLALAIQQIQAESDTREFSFKRARNEAYCLAQAIAQAALVGGDLKEANKAVGNMVAVIATRPPPKPPKSPKDPAGRNVIPELSNEELMRIAQGRASGEA